MTEFNCEQFRQNVHPLLDGELTPDEQRLMQQHMDCCADCREEYEQLREVKDMLSHMDDDLETPIEFEQGWRRAVRAESRLHRARGWVRGLSCAAAAFMLLAGATVINRHSGDLADSAAQSAQPTGIYTDQPGATDTADTALLTVATGDTADSAPLSDARAISTGTDDYATAEAAYYDGSDTAASKTQAQYDYSSSDNLGATTSGLLDVTGESTDSSASTGTTMKVLRSATLSIESENFDDDMTAIKTAVAKFGGLFERNAISGDEGSRKAELTLRVPAGFLETFVDQLRGIGHVLESEVSAQDVTSQYTDTALRLDTLRTQLARVKELTTSASDLNAILELEQEASRLQYDIDTLTGTLKGWDSQAEMSTVTVVLTEYTRVDAAFSSSGFTSQLSDQFTASMEKISGFLGDMMITLVALLPQLIWLIPVCVLAWFTVRFFRKGGTRKRRHAD